MSVIIDNEIEHDLVECPQCEALSEPDESLLGQLGSVCHYRCRYCGWQWQTPGG